MKYKIGIENMYGNLLETKEFENDDEMYSWIDKNVTPYVKSGDLQMPKVIIQVYPSSKEMSFDNCIMQYYFNGEQLL